MICGSAEIVLPPSSLLYRAENDIQTKNNTTSQIINASGTRKCPYRKKRKGKINFICKLVSNMKAHKAEGDTVSMALNMVN